MFSHLHKGRAPSHIAVTWKDGHHHCKHPLLLLPTSWLSMSPSGPRSLPSSPTLWPFSKLSSAVFHPSVPSPASSPVGWVRSRKGFALLSCDNTTPHPCVINTASNTNPEHSTILVTENINSTPVKTSILCFSYWSLPSTVICSRAVTAHFHWPAEYSNYWKKTQQSLHVCCCWINWLFFFYYWIYLTQMPLGTLGEHLRILLLFFTDTHLVWSSSAHKDHNLSRILGTYSISRKKEDSSKYCHLHK